jgi:hypothetical protein
LDKKFEVLKLFTSTFSAKRVVVAMVIYKLRAEGRRAKGRIGCLRDRKVIRKALTAVSIHGHLGRWFEGSACTG